MPESIFRVALPTPLHCCFDYLAPAGTGHDPVLPGQRVRVPFGRTHLIGVIVALVDDSAVPASKLKGIEAVLDETPLLDAAHLAFLQWTAAYYHHPVGEVILAALPLRLRKEPVPLVLGAPGWALTLEGQAVDPESLLRAPRQQQLVQCLQSAGGILSRTLLRAVMANPGSALRALQQKGWVRAVQLPPECEGFDALAAPHPLNAEQRQALMQLRAMPAGFCVGLLQGVTGSGKTEVYLQLAAETLAQDRSVLIMVPEISLTPQLQQRFEQRLGSTVMVLHSGLNKSERERAWQRARLGLSRLVLGTRSAVFVPIDRLGLVLVDEEHDSSFKQQDGFRYSARDLAIVRAKRAGCPIVLGSATPSLESLRNADLGRYQMLHLRQRAGGAVPPSMGLLDIRDQPLRGGLSESLLKAAGQALQKGEQVMLFLNRRGFAPVLGCYSCGWVSDCPRCDARQTLHKGAHLLWCHHCGSQRRVPISCPECGTNELHPLGQGTQRLEENVAELFPGVPLIRVDRDATSRKGSLTALLEKVHAADAMVLMGTQMLAKGHHFPKVTLVGILDIDGGLFSADFRAPERMAQLLLQVAGRAGRGSRPGRVLIQTRYPDHPLLQTLVKEGYEAFSRVALQEREQAQLPPFSHQALLRADAAKVEYPQQFLDAVAEQARRLGHDQVSLWGPVPAPMGRRAGRYRAHLLFQAAQRDALHRMLRQLQDCFSQLPQGKRVRWSLDVDPVDLF